MRRPHYYHVILASVCFIASLSVSGSTTDPLRSWTDRDVKQAIIQFVQRTTTRSNPQFIPPEERIAVFDTDGTLWAEHPANFQLLFAMDRVKALASKHPEWKHQEPFASALRGDTSAILAGGDRALLQIIMASHAGMTTTEFELLVKNWLATARHPRFDRPYKELVYQPMVELIGYLRANDFKTFIVSGGATEFMRPWAEAIYGVPPEQVIGSSVKTQLEIRSGKPVLVRLPEFSLMNDTSSRLIGIHSHIGREPVAAFGNSDGDRAMLEWTQSGAGIRLIVQMRHDDSVREWAYGPESAIPKDWHVISIKDDWKRVFPFDEPLAEPADF